MEQYQLNGDHLLNPNPVIHSKPTRKPVSQVASSAIGVLDSIDIYDFISEIKDPEHPYSLEELKVISEDMIQVEDDGEHCHICIQFTPTVPHCSLATTIGLCIREKLRRELEHRQFKLDISVTEGSHNSTEDVNKQINDKERVAAALENPYLKHLVDQCINTEN